MKIQYEVAENSALEMKEQSTIGHLKSLQALLLFSVVA